MRCPGEDALPLMAIITVDSPRLHLSDGRNQLMLVLQHVYEYLLRGGQSKEPSEALCSLDKGYQLPCRLITLHVLARY